MKYIIPCLAVLLLSSCGGEASQEEAYEGREETKKIEALDAVGYDGTSVRKNVDKLLENNDKRNEELKKLTE